MNDNNMKLDELVDGLLVDLPEDNYDAIEMLCKRYVDVKPKFQPYFPNFDYLLCCYVLLSEMLRVRQIAVEEPRLTGDKNSDMDIIDKYFRAAAAVVARAQVETRVQQIRQRMQAKIAR